MALFYHDTIQLPPLSRPLTCSLCGSRTIQRAKAALGPLRKAPVVWLWLPSGQGSSPAVWPSLPWRGHRLSPEHQGHHSPVHLVFRATRLLPKVVTPLPTTFPVPCCLCPAATSCPFRKIWPHVSQALSPRRAFLALLRRMKCPFFLFLQHLNPRLHQSIFKVSLFFPRLLS